MTWASANGRDWIEQDDRGWDGNQIVYMTTVGSTLIGFGAHMRQDHAGAMWGAPFPDLSR